MSRVAITDSSTSQERCRIVMHMYVAVATPAFVCPPPPPRKTRPHMPHTTPRDSSSSCAVRQRQRCGLFTRGCVCPTGNQTCVPLRNNCRFDFWACCDGYFPCAVALPARRDVVNKSACGSHVQPQPRERVRHES